MIRGLKDMRRLPGGRAAAGIVLLLTLLGIVFVGGSGATTTTTTCPTANTLNASSVGGGQSNFEIDAAVVGGTAKKPVNTAGANLTLDGASPCIDWTTAAKGAGNNDSIMTGVLVKPDKPSGAGDDSFTQGTSENDTTPTISAGSIPPNKSDLQDFGIYRESNSSGKFLDLFWSRVNAPSGTVDMDFELNKLACDGTATTCSNNGSGQFVTPLRSNGDRLVTYDLANGGTVPTISIYTWSGTSTSGSWTNGTVISGGSNPEALGSINFDAIAQADGGTLGAKSALTFGEVAISYKALFSGSGSGACGSFGSVYLKSRSSNTFTDELKDFIAPEPVQITNCTSLTTTASNATSQTEQTIGGTISDTATLSNAQSPTGGIVFKAYGPFDPTTAITNDTCVDSGTGANLQFTSPSAVALTGPDASGNYTASVPTSGAGSFTPNAAGRYEWIASYGGDANNGTSTTACGDSTEQSLVGPATPTLSTTASAGTVGVTSGTALDDTAHLGNTVVEPDGTTPAQGTITFKLYGPASTTTCIDSGTGANLVGTATIGVNGNADYKASNGTITSGTLSPTTPGTYWWSASYSGDPPNTASVSEACGGQSESSIVAKLNSTISTAQAWKPQDTATIDHSGGTVAFTLFKNSACSSAGAIVYGPDTENVTGTGPYTATTQNTTFSVTAVTGGDAYYWKAAYTSGDAQHKDVTSCTEITTFTSLANGSPVTSP